ncbi:MAG: geranylgeranylglycerol-phosphate geranylgeranyltransferase [Bacteroidales bacterium]
MLNYLRLVRYPNLLIIILTQYAIRWGVVEPLLNVTGFELQLSSFHFLLLVLSTVFITAAGYVINDYFDTHTDFLNRPRKVLVGTKIPRRTAIMLHVILSIVGTGLGIYVSFVIGIPLLGLVFLLITGILYFYSTTYKRQFLIGNFIVAILTGLVPLMVVLFEIPELNNAYWDVLGARDMNFMFVFYWVLAFAFFAFVTNLMREIVKDAQDFEGDSAYGRNSLPVVMGIKATKVVVNFLAAVTVALLWFVYARFLEFNVITTIYFTVFISIPFVLVIYKTYQATTTIHFRRIGILLKIIMLFGILYAFIARFLFYHNHDLF